MAAEGARILDVAVALELVGFAVFFFIAVVVVAGASIRSVHKTKDSKSTAEGQPGFASEVTL